MPKQKRSSKVKKRKKISKKSTRSGQPRTEKIVTESQPAEQKVQTAPMPTLGNKAEDFQRKLDAQLAGEGSSQPKRGRGRPRKDAQPVTSESDIPIELVEGFVKTPFELWSISQNVKELALADNEARQLAKSVKTLLDYYFPKVPPIVYAWGSLSVSSFWIFRIRLLLIQELKKSKSNSPESPDYAPPVNPNPVSPAAQSGNTKFPTITDVQKTKKL